MPDIGVIPELNRRLEAIARHSGNTGKRRTLWALAGFVLGCVLVVLPGPGSLLALAVFGVTIGFYFGSSRNGVPYDADVLDIYRDALQIREEALDIRNALLREQAELRSLRAEQERLLAQLKAANSGSTGR